MHLEKWVVLPGNFENTKNWYDESCFNFLSISIQINFYLYFEVYNFELQLIFCGCVILLIFITKHFYRVPGNSNILARIELLSFFEEGEADALLALNSEERNKQYKFEEVLKVVQKEHRAGNSYAGKNEYKTAAKWYIQMLFLSKFLGIS